MYSIPSFYNGVEFRSRLEARWATLFDFYRLTWAYEPEPFHTPTGIYLPDFYLLSLKTYVEVKPAPGLFDEAAVSSVSLQTNCDFLILDSPIVSCRAYPLLAHASGHQTDMLWCESERYLHSPERFFTYTSFDHPIKTESVACEFCGGLGYRDAITAARNFRFDRGHGRPSIDPRASV